MTKWPSEEEIARVIYEADPFFEAGEYVDGFKVSPDVVLSWEQAKVRDAEFADDKTMLPPTKQAYKLARAILALRGPVSSWTETLDRQRAFSTKAFGPVELIDRRLGIVDHIRKELTEVEADPSDLSEWIDLAMLAFDGAWRSGFTSAQIIEAYQAKLAKNEKRDWPDWRDKDPNKAIEHVRAAPRSSTAEALRHADIDLSILLTLEGEIPNDVRDQIRETLKLIDAALALPAGAVAIPDGWKLAPVEATDEMLESALTNSGDRVAPYEAPRESGVPVEQDISNSDAHDFNEQIKAQFADLYRWLLSAAPQPPKGTGWQPIETAPKDGTRVDLWCRSAGFHGGGRWRITDCWYFDGKWWRDDFEHGDDQCRSEVRRPTHWMPLPAAPTADAKGTGE